MQAQTRLVGYVNDAAPKNWIAAMTLAERRWPEEFGRRDRNVISVDVESIKSLFTELEDNRRKHLVTLRDVTLPPSCNALDVTPPVMLSG